MTEAEHAKLEALAERKGKPVAVLLHELVTHALRRRS